MGIPQFALVEFFNELTVHICDVSGIKKPDTSNLTEEDVSKWNKEEEVFVYWQTKQNEEKERCPCRIVQFSDDRQLLVRLQKKMEKGEVLLESVPLFARTEQLGKGRREKMVKRPAEVDTLSKKKQKQPVRPDPVIENIKSSFHTKLLNTTTAESEKMRKQIEELQSEVEDLKEEYRYERKQRIKAEKELREWKEMNNLIVQLKGTVGELQSLLLRKRTTEGRDERQDVSEPINPKTTALETSPLLNSEDASEMVTLSGGLKVKKALMSRINTTSYQRYTTELLVIVFGRDMLASHSLNGRKASNKADDSIKDSLPAETVSQLIEHVQSKFNVEPGLVRAAIRTKLNNEDKMRKRRVLE